MDTSALFSPSKARVQQAQAKDWASVDSWLSKRYSSKRLPTFERNEETLHALLTLATLNESADEQRSLVDRVEKAALQAHSKRSSSAAENDLEPLMKELHANEALKTLAETTVCLNSPDVDSSTIAKAISDLTAQKFAAEQQVRRAEDQLQALKSEQDKVAKILKDIQDDSFEPPPDLPEQTSEWTRNAKQLKAKLGEYDERLAAIRGMPQPKVHLEDVWKQAEESASDQLRLDELNLELNAYQSLPADAKAARAKLESAREDLLKLTRQRDDLFEHLADG